MKNVDKIFAAGDFDEKELTEVLDGQITIDDFIDDELEKLFYQLYKED